MRLRHEYVQWNSITHVFFFFTRFHTTSPNCSLIAKGSWIQVHCRPFLRGVWMLSYYYCNFFKVVHVSTSVNSNMCDTVVTSPGRTSLLTICLMGKSLILHNSRHKLSSLNPSCALKTLVQQQPTFNHQEGMCKSKKKHTCVKCMYSN